MPGLALSVADNFNWSSSYVVFYAGGNYNQNRNHGWFYLNGNTATNHSANIGARQLYA